MRVSPLVPVAMFVLMSGSAAAQGWVEYTSQQDRFIVNFPGQPVVREIPYPTEFGITLSARVYTVAGWSEPLLHHRCRLLARATDSCRPGQELPGISRHVHEPLDERPARRARLCGLELPSTGRQGDVLRLR